MSWRRILAEAPQVDDRNGVSYFETECRSLLNQVRAPLPFDLSLNPYLNCELSCSYCYARDFTSKRQAGEGSFEREIYAKRNAPQVLKRELVRLIRSGRATKPIAIGTATDPYQPLERRSGLTRKLLGVLAEAEGLRISLTTKSDLVLRDLDLLGELARKGTVRVNITITTTDRDLARSMEPRAPTPLKRLQAVEGLARAGVPVGVFCMPILPAITEGSRDLRRLVCAAKGAGAGWFGTRVLALRPGVRGAFFAWLEQERPGLVHRYRRMYRRGPNPPEYVRERIERLVDALRRQYRLPSSLPFPPAPPGVKQLDLFESAAVAGKRLPVVEGGAAA